MKPKEHGYFSFGSSLHACAEHFYRVSAPPPPSLPELLQFYERNWLSAGYESAEEEARYKAYGREILTRFWGLHSPRFCMPVATEKQFYVNVEGVKLTGYIDRVDKLESGGLGIVDYKSNKDLFTTEHLANDLQLTIYQYAAEQVWQLPVEKLTLYHLRSNTACSCPPRDTQELNRARVLVVEVAEKIASQEFPATENSFCPCDFAECCPYYRHLYPPPRPAPKQKRLPGFDAVEAVEEYVSLQGEMKELEARIDEARKAIIDFCERQGLKRVYGTRHAITCQMAERTAFDEAQVKPLLVSAGLWERVQSFDPARLKDLIAGGDIDPALKKKLEGLCQVMSTFYSLRVRGLHEEKPVR